jgi:hypothetical protein
MWHFAMGKTLWVRKWRLGVKFELLGRFKNRKLENTVEITVVRVVELEINFF